MNARLPKLIFAEDHYDPITGKLLQKLAPKLKSLGYEVFFNEDVPNLTLEQSIEAHEKSTALYLELKEHFDELNLDINNEEDYDLFFCTTLAFNKSISNPSDFLVLFPTFCHETYDLVNRYQATLSFKSFLLDLKTNNINYKTIDIKEVIEYPPNEIISEWEETRVKNFVNTYLKASNVFGRHGLAHVQGMQNEILKTTELINAQNDFCFFNVYSKLPLPNFDGYEEKVRTGKIAFPMGLTQIDASHKTLDEVADLVIQEINSKIVKQKPEQEKINYSPTLFPTAKVNQPSIILELETSVPSRDR